MHRIKIFFIGIIFLFILTSCQTIQDKTDSIVEKENKRLTKLIGKTSKDLRLELGEPDEDFKNIKGNLELIYKTKKYGILCERKFEVDQNSIIIGFISKGCF
tara:strand:- start:128 stop:433 length:306 start_codon:yes stop_codon:yes gene_type:complete